VAPELELLRRVKDVFERQRIFYFVTGSIASISYGEPRTTNDIDVVVAIQESQVRAICDAFPSPEFYVSEEAARDAVRTHFQFNILHPATGLKVDVIILGDTEFDRTMVKRVHQLQLADDLLVTMIAPEDVVLNKLLFYREGGSDKHLRDVAGVMRVHGVNRQYIAEWANRLGVNDIWEAVVAREKEAC
jgi:hypothetical protein